MKTYKYPLLAEIIYKYANFPISIFLFLYVIISVAESFQKIYFIIPLILNIVILYLLNKYYYKSYKVLPFKIKIDNKKIICENFYLSKKIIELKLTDISEIKGGVFSGSQTSPIYLISKSQEVTIKINHHLQNYNELLTVILSNIDQKLYNSLLKTMKDYAEAKSAALKKDKK